MARMEHGAPGPVEADLSVTAAVPDQDVVIRLESGSEESSVHHFARTGSGCATVSITDFPPLDLVRTGLVFVVGDPLEICPPSPFVTLDLEQVWHVEGETAQIPFTLSSKAPAGFTLRYTTGADEDPNTVDADPTTDFTATGVAVEEGDSKGVISILIINDTEIDEGIREVFVVELAPPADGSPYRIGSTHVKTTVTIKDGICDHTEQVRDNLLEGLHASDCAEVTSEQLSQFTGGLDLSDNDENEDNDIQELKPDDFRGLSGMGTLILNDNRLRRFPDGLFDGLSGLTRLYVQRNNLDVLAEGVFSDLSALRTLSIDGNSLETLPPGVFTDLAQLRYLDASENQIRSLDAAAFRGLKRLEHLILDENEIAALPQGVFNGLSSANLLGLAHNRLASLDADAFDGLRHLQVLRLHHNRIPTLPDGLLDVFNHLDALRLHHNLLTELPQDLLSEQPHIYWLDIDHNLLTEIPDGFFEGLVELKHLRAEGNPGSDFVLSHEISADDDHSGHYYVEIAEGTPFDLVLGLSIVGGTSDTSSVTVEAGNRRSASFSVEDAEGDLEITLSYA